MVTLFLHYHIARRIYQYSCLWKFARATRERRGDNLSWLVILAYENTNKQLTFELETNTNPLSYFRHELWNKQDQEPVVIPVHFKLLNPQRGIDETTKQ